MNCACCKYSGDSIDDVIAETFDTCPTLALFWVDGGYPYTVPILRDTYHIMIDVVRKYPKQRTFVVLPRRWVVERTFAWLGRYRILSKEYTHRPEYTKNWIYLALIYRILNRIAPSEYRK